MVDKKDVKTLAVICARGGSQRLKNKNLLLLNGKSLLQYVVEDAQKSNCVTNCCCTTDNKEIKELVNKLDMFVVNRPKEYAKDDSPIQNCVVHAVRMMELNLPFSWEEHKYDIVVILQGNIPFHKEGMIDNCVNTLILNWDSCSSVVTIKKTSETPYWVYKKNINNINTLFRAFKPDGVDVVRKQDTDAFFMLDGSVQAVKRDTLMSNKDCEGVHCYLGKNIIGILQERPYTLEIDDYWDYKFVKAIMEGKQ